MSESTVAFRSALYFASFSPRLSLVDRGFALSLKRAQSAAGVDADDVA